MKSLKPDIQKEKLMTQKTADELKAEIQALQASLVDLQSQISDIEEELDVPNVGRGSASFDSITTTDLTATNGTITNLGFTNGAGTTIDVNDVEAVNITATNVIDTPHLNTADADITNAEIDTLKVNTSFTAPEVTTPLVTTSEVSATTATVGTLNASIVNAGNYETSKVTANEVETPLANITEAVIDGAAISHEEVEDSLIVEGEITTLKNKWRYFKDDDEVIQVTADSQKPAYIEIDTKGVQTAKLMAKDDRGELFSLIYSNARHTPLIQWSKRNPDAINKLFYSPATNKLYIQTYANSEIQWSIDGFEKEPHSIKTYSELMPEPISDCYRYNCGRKQGMVLMGDGEDGVVLSVQGTIEGNFLVDSGDFVSVNYYGNSAYDLLKIAKAFFRQGSDEDGWKYERAQVYGYIRHDDTVTPAHWEYSTTVVTSDDFTFDDVNTYTPNEALFLEDALVADTYYEVAKVEFDGVELYTAYDSDDNVLATNPNLTGFNYYTRTWVTPAHSPYRDPDNTEVEALEKVELIDDYTVKLTVDCDYGQDEITIDCHDTIEGDTLPFTLGFTVRTPMIDKTFNEEAPVVPGGRGSSDFNGQF